jgi:hypothetical protein
MVHSPQLYDYDAQVAEQSALVGPNAYALPFMFPPYGALLFTPFSQMSYRTAYHLFLVINICFACGSIAILTRYCRPLNDKWRLLVAFLVFTFLPLGIAFVFGQVSIVLLLLYCATFAATQERKPILAGMILSVAMIKFQIALPVALLFLLWKQWRFLAGFVSGSATLTFISSRIVGLKVVAAYFHSLIYMASQTSSETKFAMFSAQMPNLYGFFHSVVPGLTGIILTVLCSLAVIAYAAWQRPSVSTALLAGMIVSYHMYFYDLTLLLLPICLIFSAELETEQSRPALWASLSFILAPIIRPLAMDFQYLFLVPLVILFLTVGAVGAVPIASPKQKVSYASGSA